MRLTILGSGDAFSSGGRRQSAYLLDTAAHTVLIDCGATVLGAFRDAGRDPGDLDAVVLSHLHGDHFAGLPFLFLEFLYERPRDRPLTVYGPGGTEDRVRTLFAAMYKESAGTELPFELRFVELEAGPAREVLPGLELRAVAVPHQKSEPSFALHFAADGQRLLYSGDSAWTETFVTESEGVDLFLCECTYWSDLAPVHVNYEELDRQLPRLQARRVVLSHLGRTMLERLDEVRVECARDGWVIDLGTGPAEAAF